jgi:hypothetical protein
VPGGKVPGGLNGNSLEGKDMLGKVVSAKSIYTISRLSWMSESGQDLMLLNNIKAFMSGRDLPNLG